MCVLTKCCSTPNIVAKLATTVKVLSSEQIQQVKSLAKVFCIRMEVQQKFAGALAAATAQRRCTTKGVGGALGHTVARDRGRLILGGEGEPELPKLSV